MVNVGRKSRKGKGRKGERKGERETVTVYIVRGRERNVNKEVRGEMQRL